MATILKNVVVFTGLTTGVPASLPHGLNVNGTAAQPQLCGFNAAGFTATADATNVTVTKTAAATVSAVSVYVERWHTIENVLPANALATLTPFFFVGGGGGGGAPQLPVVTAAPGNFTAAANATNLIPADQAGPITVTFPAAASAPGALLALNMFNTGSVVVVGAVPAGGDKINNAAGGVSLNSQTLEAIFVSDGVSNWWQIANFISPNGTPVVTDGITIAGTGVAGSPLAEANVAILTGTTPGAGAGETVTLKTAANLNWVPDANKDYTVNLTVTCRGVISAAPVVQSFTQTLSIRKAASAVTIAAASAQAQIGDAAAASWTILCAGGPSSFTVTFTTGATTSACVVTAKLALTEA